jgi:surfeit locus 1 family protein
MECTIIKCQNWKLAILALVLMIFFISMGCWQLSRANEKKSLLKQYSLRTQHLPLSANAITRTGDWRFFQAQLTGHFDNDHTLLLDNKIHEGKIGYEVYTPFQAEGLTTPILVDRGFIPMGKSRKELPVIRTISGNTTITGLLNLPPAYVSFGKLLDSTNHGRTLRVEYIQLAELSSLLHRPLFSYVLNLSPHHPAAYDIEWQIVTMKPEKHMGYAIQWFAFALTLLILFVALNRPRIHF